MDLLQTVRKEGSRGGRSEFKWEDVKQDAQRENYLGHSLMAPVGRWQQGRDLNWYAKGDDSAESQQSAAEKLAEEKRKVKEAEEDAMLRAMGLPVPDRASTNANLTPLGEKAQGADVDKAIDEKAKEGDRDEKKREKAEKTRKHRDGENRERRRRHRSRSRSRDHRDRRRDRSRSRDGRRDRHGDDGDRDRDRRRRRSRSREHRGREDHYEHRKYNERPRSRSRDRDRRRRSRSPYDRHERRRD
ncbi:hypothetical protein CC80DRAFT_513093 [Byssothecium circinans]|uniref:Multiple myeloma tumor-associated protein 2-like N-terminal domain-containing protein n=1 Tax=Byssothecium circinans TaxID=147558 RepID=A0A6A5U877_9PLEO|nr:hypothetical protein CC80DRAFT_513093 [Byssothecium circinans]